MKKQGKILLSFDIEEFDLPREHGAEISLEEGVKVSKLGLERILKILKDEKMKATFLVTGNFAKMEPEIVKRIEAEGHEVGCHGVDHFKPQEDDIIESKKIIEAVLGHEVYGYRQPRMGKIAYKKMKVAGYLYDSSVNPAFIPGRYNNLKTPREPYMKEGILEIPTSVATGVRIPLFWLALHLFPKWLYLFLAKRALKRDGYFATYFHPWEFSEIREYKIPSYIKLNSGKKMGERLRYVIRNLKGEDMIYYEYSKFKRV